MSRVGRKVIPVPKDVKIQLKDGQVEVPRVYGGLGINILSTSRGVMTGREAAKTGVGGEILCNVW